MFYRNILESRRRTVRNIVAVYGTLKRGHGNHYYLRNSKYLDKGVSLQKFLLGHSSFPAVIPCENGVPIVVELYSVSRRTLMQLDRLEGVPTLYKKSPFLFRTKEGAITAILYFMEETNELFNWELPKGKLPYWWTKKGWRPWKTRLRRRQHG